MTSVRPCIMRLLAFEKMSSAKRIDTIRCYPTDLVIDLYNFQKRRTGYINMDLLCNDSAWRKRDKRIQMISTLNDVRAILEHRSSPLWAELHDMIHNGGILGG
jgi:hypothetical protein